MKKNHTWLIAKVIVLIIALVGVFWARSLLQENVPAPEAPTVTIPAKVEFGK